MSGENNEYKDMDFGREAEEAPKPESAESCAWLKHCESNLFGPPAADGASESEPAEEHKESEADYLDDLAKFEAAAEAPAYLSLDAPGDSGETAEAGDTDEGGEAAPVKPLKVKKSKEKLPAFPRLTSAPQAPATLFSRLFDVLALAGPAVLTALLLAQVFFPLLEPRPLWAPAETVFADVLRGVLNGDWLILSANGQVYFDAPPLYFWFLAGVHQLISLPGLEFLSAGAADKIALAIFTGSAFSGLLLLWATMFMARGVANFDRRGVFAAGAVLLGLFVFAGTLHYGSQDLFFCALVVTSQAFLFKGLRRSSSMLNIGLGFAFAALAFLAKGLPGLLLPLLCAVLFAFWQGRPWRLLHKDFLLGFLFSLLPAVLWVGVIWADGHYEVVVRIIKEQFIGAVFLGLDYSGPWWYYLIALPVLLLPWVFLAIFPNWLGLFSRETAKAAGEAFRGSRQGLAFVWLALVCALGSFFLLSLKSPLDILLLFAPLSIVAGRIMLGLSPLRNMLLQRILAVFFLALALAFAVLPVYFSGRAESVLGWLGSFGLPVLGVDIGGVFIISLAFLAAGCLLIGPVNARRPESSILVVLFLVVGISCPFSTLSAPSLGKLLSPAESAVELRNYMERGYRPLALGVDGAPFAYYAGAAVPAFGEDALDLLPEEGEPVILLTGPVQAEALAGRSDASPVAAFQLAGESYRLLALGAFAPEPEAEGAAPAEPGAAEAPAQAGADPLLP